MLNHSILKTKKVEKRLRKMFRPALGCTQHPKAGLNTQLSVICILPVLPWSPFQNEMKCYTFNFEWSKTDEMQIFIFTERFEMCISIIEIAEKV